MTDLATHRQKKVQAMSWKNFADARILPFLHGVEWDRLIVHRTRLTTNMASILSFGMQKCSHITVAVNVLRPISNGMNMRGVCLQNHPPLD